MNENISNENLSLFQKFKKIVANRYLNFVLSTIILLLIVIWTGNFWLLLIEPIIVDFYLTKKVNWTFWKKRNVKKHPWWVEWVDAAVFAIIAASIIRGLLIEAYVIPTSSMEKSLLVGDYLFVSKYHYGPRLPMTPVAIPFTHHSIPGTQTKAYTDKIQMKFKRLAGLEDIENDHVVVFNFPAGDSVALNQQAQSYYQLCRDYGRKNVQADQLVNPNTGQIMNGYFGKIIYRPVDKRENYIKRCVAIAGDSLLVKDGEVFINGKPQGDIPKMQYKYAVVTDGSPINPKVFENLNISNEDKEAGKYIDPNIFTYMNLNGADAPNMFVFPLTSDRVKQLKTLPNIKQVEQIIKPAGYKEDYIFPHTKSTFKITDNNLSKMKAAIPDSIVNLMNDLSGKTFADQNQLANAVANKIGNTSAQTYFTTIKKYSDDDIYKWNEDNFGPIWIPKAGATTPLNLDNLPLYRRIIDVFEGNDLEVKGNDIFINGEKATEYTFKMDYYFMMGDSRHNSADSRFWGYVPEDHVVGKALFIWMSRNKDKTMSFRLKRIFKKIK